MFLFTLVNKSLVLGYLLEQEVTLLHLELAHLALPVNLGTHAELSLDDVQTQVTFELHFGVGVAADLLEDVFYLDYVFTEHSVVKLLSEVFDNLLVYLVQLIESLV